MYCILMASRTTAFVELCFVWYYLYTLKFIIKAVFEVVNIDIHCLLGKVVIMGTTGKILQKKFFTLSKEVVSMLQTL